MAIAVVLTQLLPICVLRFLGQDGALANRTKGSLTGSRVAGACGNVVMFEALESCSMSIKGKGFSLGNFQEITLQTWVDNMFAYSSLQQ